MPSNKYVLKFIFVKKKKEDIYIQNIFKFWVESSSFVR